MSRPRHRTAPLTALLLMLGSVAMGSAFTASAQSDPFAAVRRQMVDEQIRRRGVTEPGVVRAMEEVPRHLFVPDRLRDQAYFDRPLPIGSDQTISQPYIVALMTSLLELDGGETVLEIGTGSGYQAAILSRLARDVYTIEIREDLGKRAKQILTELGYDNIHSRIGDGYQGWPEAAPFDGILVTAAPDRVPEPLIEQLKVGGKIVIPVGEYLQQLLVVTKTADGIERREVTPVKFVPMIGEVERKPDKPR